MIVLAMNWEWNTSGVDWENESGDKNFNLALNINLFVFMIEAIWNKHTHFSTANTQILFGFLGEKKQQQRKHIMA